ncbi:MAG: hypothetical protein WAL59_22665 [Roseiarcus sp.]
MPGIIQVDYTPVAPQLTRKESIHPRRILPRVREGKERQFHSSSRQTTFVQAAPRAFGAQAATDELSISINTELPEPGSQQTASNVGEPSVAINGDVVFYAGNWQMPPRVRPGRAQILRVTKFRPALT